MPKMNMTELGIKRLDFAKTLASHVFAHLTPEQRAKMKQFDMFDESGVPGLFLRVSSGGSKSWRVVYCLITIKLRTLIAATCPPIDQATCRDR